MAQIESRSDPALRRSIARRDHVAVIPVGSIEQHGPHLPLSTDSDIATEIARRIADRRGFLLLPTLTYGVSYEHAPFFNLSISNATLRAVLRDLCMSLLDNGIRTVFVINGHHGNIRSIRDIGARLQRLSKRRLRVFAFSYWHFMEREFDHAGFAETSLMLALSRDVKMGLARRGLVTDSMSRQEIRRISRIAARSFPEATGNGVWGDPTGASRRDGQKLLAEIIRNLSKRCQTCLTEDSS